MYLRKFMSCNYKTILLTIFYEAWIRQYRRRVSIGHALDMFLTSEVACSFFFFYKLQSGEMSFLRLGFFFPFNYSFL